MVRFRNRFPACLTCNYRHEQQPRSTEPQQSEDCGNTAPVEWDAKAEKVDRRATSTAEQPAKEPVRRTAAFVVGHNMALHQAYHGCEELLGGDEHQKSKRAGAAVLD